MLYRHKQRSLHVQKPKTDNQISVFSPAPRPFFSDDNHFLLDLDHREPQPWRDRLPTSGSGTNSLVFLLPLNHRKQGWPPARSLGYSSQRHQDNQRSTPKPKPAGKKEKTRLLQQVDSLFPREPLGLQMRMRMRMRMRTGAKTICLWHFVAVDSTSAQGLRPLPLLLLHILLLLLLLHILPSLPRSRQLPEPARAPIVTRRPPQRRPGQLTPGDASQASARRRID